MTSWTQGRDIIHMSLRTRILSGSSIPFPTDWWYVSEPGPTLRICGKVLNSGATTSSPRSVPKCSPRTQVPLGAQAVWVTPEALKVKQDTEEMSIRAGFGGSPFFLCNQLMLTHAGLYCQHQEIMYSCVGFGVSTTSPPPSE